MEQAKLWIRLRCISDPPVDDALEAEHNVFETRKDDHIIVSCAILTSLDTDLQKRFEHHDAYEMVQEIKTMFQT